LRFDLLNAIDCFDLNIPLMDRSEAMLALRGTALPDALAIFIPAFPAGFAWGYIVMLSARNLGGGTYDAGPSSSSRLSIAVSVYRI